MVCRVVILAALALFPRVFAAEETPVGKALSLISNLQAKVVAQGEEAQKVFAKFAEWCDDRSKQLHFEIDTGKAQIAELKASIDEDVASLSTLGAKIESLSGSLAKDDMDLKAATAIRKEEEETYSKEKAELLETINTIERAIGILQRERGAASLAQLDNAGSLADALEAMVEASVVSSADAKRLTSLVQGGDSDVDAPAAAVYQSQSGGIIETLEGLLDKAQEQLAATEKKEVGAKHGFAMLKQSLEDQIKFADESMASARANSAASATAKATAEGDLSATSKEFGGDSDALAQLHQDCLTKSEDFEASMKSRAEELKALAEAKKVISEATGAAVAQTYSAASFLQVSKHAHPTSVFAALRRVRRLAQDQQSSSLAQLASRIDSAVQASDRAGQDPFAKVKDLIAGLISKLEEEGSSDASHKSFCDKELRKSTEKKIEKSAEVDKIATAIDKMSARSMELKEEVAALQAGLAKLAASQADMTKLRQEENAVYVKFKAEVEEGLAGVKAALKILREYYSNSAAHGAALGTGTSIIGLLEVVESDFLKGLAEEAASEHTAASAYDSESKENKIEMTSKEQSVKYKNKEIADLAKATGQETSDREGVQAELDAVLEYLEKLAQQCTEVALPYAERKARREAEIAGLKDALAILEEETASFLQQDRRSRRGLRSYTVSPTGAL